MSARHSQPVCCAAPLPKKARRSHVWHARTTLSLCPKLVARMKTPVIETGPPERSRRRSTPSASIKMNGDGGGDPGPSQQVLEAYRMVRQHPKVVLPSDGGRHRPAVCPREAAVEKKILGHGP